MIRMRRYALLLLLLVVVTAAAHDTGDSTIARIHLPQSKQTLFCNPRRPDDIMALQSAYMDYEAVNSTFDMYVHMWFNDDDAFLSDTLDEALQGNADANTNSDRDGDIEACYQDRLIHIKQIVACFIEPVDMVPYDARNAETTGCWTPHAESLAEPLLIYDVRHPLDVYADFQAYMDEHEQFHPLLGNVWPGVLFDLENDKCLEWLHLPLHRLWTPHPITLQITWQEIRDWRIENYEPQPPQGIDIRARALDANGDTEMIHYMPLKKRYLVADINVAMDDESCLKMSGKRCVTNGNDNDADIMQGFWPWLLDNVYLLVSVGVVAPITVALVATMKNRAAQRHRVYIPEHLKRASEEEINNSAYLQSWRDPEWQDRGAQHRLSVKRLMSRVSWRAQPRQLEEDNCFVDALLNDDIDSVATSVRQRRAEWQFPLP
jgi:hypothetical protein